MTYVGHDIVYVVLGIYIFYFHPLIRHMGHNDGCRTRSRKCLPFRSTWFHLRFSFRFMLSCLLISCDSLVFWILSFYCSFSLIAWYLYFLLHTAVFTATFAGGHPSGHICNIWGVVEWIVSLCNIIAIVQSLRSHRFIARSIAIAPSLRCHRSIVHHSVTIAIAPSCISPLPSLHRHRHHSITPSLHRPTLKNKAMELYLEFGPTVHHSNVLVKTYP